MRERKHTYTVFLAVQLMFDIGWHDGLWFDLGLWLRVCVKQQPLHEGKITITFKIGNQWLNEVQKAEIGITIKTDVIRLAV